MIGLTYREATPADSAAIAAFVKQAFRGDSSRKGWTTEADLVSDDRIDANGVTAKINTPRSAILLAYDDNSQLTACCEVACKENSLGYLGLFAVDPERQGGGIGRLVLEHAEKYAREKLGATKMEMTVIWTREELLTWYERRGYTRTTETRPFPYAHLVNGKALRDDLHFIVLDKELRA